VDGSRRPAAWRYLGDGDVGVWVAYHEREVVKAVPTARWDPSLKCWRIRVHFADLVDDVVADVNRARRYR